MEYWARLMVAAIIGIAIMNIFGNKGILITLSFMALALFLVYYFQNNLLYMPGKDLVSETSQIRRIAQETTHRATDILPSKASIPNKSA